jgi:hypothetical protein
MEWVGVAQDLITKWITSRTASTYTASNVVLEGRYVQLKNMMLESRSQCSAQIVPDASLAKQTPKAITAILSRTLTWRCHPTISITVNQLSPDTTAHRYYRYTNSANIGVSLNAYPSGNLSCGYALGKRHRDPNIFLLFSKVKPTYSRRLKLLINFCW